MGNKAYGTKKRHNDDDDDRLRKNFRYFRHVMDSINNE